MNKIKLLIFEYRIVKKKLFFIVLLIIGFSAFGQTSRPKNLPLFGTKKLHFGYTIGIGAMDFRMSFNEGHYAEMARINPAIFLGVISDLSIGKHSSIRFLPGISFGQRDIEIRDSELLPRIETVFIELPLLIKYSSVRLNNFAPYLIAGFNPRMDLTGGELIRGRVADRLVRFFDIYYEMGVGFDSYLQQVRLSTELKFSIGMRDVFLPVATEDYMPYSNAFKALFSKLMILSFHIE